MARIPSYHPCGYTCPKIDSVIEFLIEVQRERDFGVQEFIDIMEQIRSDNDSLRTWGDELYHEKEYLERDVYNLKEELEELKKEKQEPS